MAWKTAVLIDLPYRLLLIELLDRSQFPAPSIGEEEAGVVVVDANCGSVQLRPPRQRLQRALRSAVDVHIDRDKPQGADPSSVETKLSTV
jgi:hypothetical protein